MNNLIKMKRNNDLATISLWKKIVELPGFQVELIVEVATEIFGSYQKMNIANIEVCSNAFCKSDHISDYMRRLTYLLDTEGRFLNSRVLDINKFLKGYQAECLAFSYQNYYVLLVHDSMGFYIYRWPVQEESISHAQNGQRTIRN